MNDPNRFRRPPSQGSAATPAGSAHSDTAQPSSHAQPTSHAPQTYAPPNDAPSAAGSPHYAPPAGSPHYAPLLSNHGASMQYSSRDAPLIHPAAARVSTNMPPYGVPVYYSPQGYPAADDSKSLSIAGLVLGLCSVLLSLVIPVLALLGIVVSAIGLRREPAGRVFAGIGLGASLLGLVAPIVLFVIPIVIGIMSFANSNFG